MTELTRRRLLGGAAGAAALTPPNVQRALAQGAPKHAVRRARVR
ncbi:hypothetical protein [Amycolatopsis kentuckyensis]